MAGRAGGAGPSQESILSSSLSPTPTLEALLSSWSLLQLLADKQTSRHVERALLLLEGNLSGQTGAGLQARPKRTGSFLKIKSLGEKMGVDLISMAILLRGFPMLLKPCFPTYFVAKANLPACNCYNPELWSTSNIASHWSKDQKPTLPLQKLGPSS